METTWKIKKKNVLEYKKRVLVRRILTKALKKAEVVKANACELCNESGTVEAHHIDYGRPLQVLWLCDKCHGKVHCKDHPLNPDNNIQTALPVDCQEPKQVTVSFSLPVANFLALKKASEESGMTVSKLLRLDAMRSYAVEDQQLKFNFMESKNDDTQQMRHKRIQSLGTNEEALPQPSRAKLQKIWRQGNTSRHNMDGVQKLLQGYGGHAKGLQRIGAN